MARTLYQKFRDIWKDKPDKTTPVTAEAMMHIEDGILKNSENMALKEIYGDTAISLNRKKDTVTGYCSYAFGGDVEASGLQSHAEGAYTVASGVNSHAEGANATASGGNSHAEGAYTVASQFAQHVQGMYNIEDTNLEQGRGTYAHIVGNGHSEEQRSNAHTLDWNGNAWFAGDVENGAGVTMNALLSRIESLEQRILELEKEE